MEIVGLDLGNRYAKLYSEICNDSNEKTYYKDELIVSWRHVSASDFIAAEMMEGVTKVKYKDLYYLVGNIGNTGISNRNKGFLDVAEQSNMIKCTLLARYLATFGKKEGYFGIVTGTPYDDYEKNQNDYIKFMISKDAETIELDGVVFKMMVREVKTTKQGACVIHTLEDRRTSNYLIWDFGGETLDVSYFEHGHRIAGLTSDFSMNRLYVELAKELNVYFDVDRPKLLDARSQKSMETLSMQGVYRGITEVEIDGTIVSLAMYIHAFYAKRVSSIVKHTINELDINRTALNNLTNVFVGGGSKVIEKELSLISELKNKRFFEDPQYANVIAYFKIGQKEWE